MFDYEQLAKDMRNFFNKLRGCYENNRFKYIYGIELGANGSFHMHCVLFWEDVAPKNITQNWEKGYAHDEPVENEEGFINLTLYLSYYKGVSEEKFAKVFPGLTIEEIASLEYISDTTPQEIKQLIKIARFYLFPIGKKAFPHSPGMKDEIIKNYEVTEAEEKQFLCEKTSTNEIDGIPINNTYKYYKIK